MIYYLVYKLTNLVNGKIYIGCHMTKNLDDGYMGSGRRIRYALKKYGAENFKKEILKVCETADEMLAEEKKIVDEEFLKRSDVYNLTCGGRGSWFWVNASGVPKFAGKKHTKEARQKMGHAFNDHFLGKTHTAEIRSSISTSLRGRKRSAESIAKQKEVWRRKRAE